MPKNIVNYIRDNMKSKSDEELLNIWKENNRNEYSDDAFKIIKELILERNLELPEQNEALLDNDSQITSLSLKSKIIKTILLFALVIFWLYFINIINPSNLDQRLIIAHLIGWGVIIFIIIFRMRKIWRQ